MVGESIAHYTVSAKLGEGGMGVVYKAEDTKLRRTVALKFLPSHAAENRERFFREAQAAASLNHPNICTIHEIDDEHGFIAMEFIEGPSLKQKIEVRPLPLNEALDIAIQSCSGLQAAHEKGIVHRDIKPANVMLTPQGQVKIMDFGLAQVGDRTRLTKSNTSMGTPAYMSPEQAQGQATDKRTDIWSLGVVLYEMLTGRRPFAGQTEAACTYSIVHSEPEPPTAVRSGLPRDIDRILAKLLRKKPEERYASADDVAVDLRMLRGEPATARQPRKLIVAGVAAGALLSAGIWWFGVGRQPAGEQIRSLAILPLRTLSGQQQDHLGIGVADAVITRISQAPGLTVRPTSSIRKYTSPDTDSLKAASELRVDAVLDGSLQRDGDRLRVSVNLLRVRDGASLWAETFQLPIRDIFEVQDELARQVSARLRFGLNPNKLDHLRRGATTNPEAYEYYLRAMRLFDARIATATFNDLEPVIAHFEKAISLDQNYALAHANLAYAYCHVALFAKPDDPVWIERSRKELAIAAQLNPELPEIHRVRYEIFWSVHEGFQLDQSVRELKLAQERDPNFGHSELGILYSHMGLEKAALRELNRGLELEPGSDYPMNRAVEARQYLGLDDEAIAENLRLYRVPGAPWSLLAKGRIHDARPIIEADYRRNPNSAQVIGKFLLLLALDGRSREAEDLIPKIDRMPKDRSYHHGTYGAALYFALKGDATRAVEYLRKTTDTGMPDYLLFSRDPHLAPIRKEAAFVSFMNELRPRWEEYKRKYE